MFLLLSLNSSSFPSLLFYLIQSYLLISLSTSSFPFFMSSFPCLFSNFLPFPPSSLCSQKVKCLICVDDIKDLVYFSTTSYIIPYFKKKVVIVIKHGTIKHNFKLLYPANGSCLDQVFEMTV